MSRLLFAALSVFVPILVHAAELIVPLPGRDGLVLDVPEGWVAHVQRPRQDLPPTISLASRQQGAFQVLITPIWPAPQGQPPQRPDLLRLVQDAAQQAAPHAVEQDSPLRPIEAPGKIGFYFSATDRDPKPGEYKHLTQGAIGFSELRVTFTILVNGTPEPIVKEALAMLKSATRAKGKGAV